MSRDRIDICEDHQAGWSLRPHGQTLGVVEGAILRTWTPIATWLIGH